MQTELRFKRIEQHQRLNRTQIRGLQQSQRATNSAVSDTVSAQARLARRIYDLENKVRNNDATIEVAARDHEELRQIVRDLAGGVLDLTNLVKKNAYDIRMFKGTFPIVDSINEGKLNDVHDELHERINRLSETVAYLYRQGTCGTGDRQREEDFNFAIEAAQARAVNAANERAYFTRPQLQEDING